MKSNLFVILLFLISIQVLAAGEILVGPDTISYSGYSGIEDDKSIVYGGIAGTCASPDNVSTCNTCTDKTSLNACNTTSVYPDLSFKANFKITKAVTNAIGRIVATSSAASGVEGTSVTLPAATYADSADVTLAIPWSAICASANLGTTCTGTTGVYTAKVGFGIDSDASGDVVTDELKYVNIKIHYIAPADSTTASRSYCATSATGYGVCKIEFEPGDAKVYITENFIIGGADTSNTGGAIDFDAIAIFPIPVASDKSGDTNAIINFTTGQVAPIFKDYEIKGTEVNIPNSEVSDNLKNYQRYCFIYGNKNKAQNIYFMVAGSAVSADATTIAQKSCLAPSEVVGILYDKHCFISTAAFGSDMAPEVKTFRAFRNQYLLQNDFGKLFVHFYNEVSPPIANIISKNEFLRASTRGVLYPALAFSYISIHYGILAAILTLFVFLILISRISFFLKNKKILLMIALLLIISPSLKAQVESDSQIIQHPDAQEGLIKIKKDGTYIYDVKRTLKTESSRITFGQAMQPEISIDIEGRDANGNGNNTFKTFKFDDFYEGASKLILGYDYEWFPWVNKGKLGLQVGGSLMYAQGHGIQLANLQASQEKFTFITLPLTAGAVYRLEWKDKQIFAPYASGGGTYTVLFEKREDKTKLDYTGAPGFYAAAGGLFNLSVLDSESGFALDSEYGISNLWVSLEYKIIEVDSDAFKFSNQYIDLGLSFDF